MQSGQAFAAFALAAALMAAPVAAEQNPPAKSKKASAKSSPKAAGKRAADKAAPAPAAESKRAAAPAPSEPSRVVYTPEKPKLPEGAVQIAPGLWSHIDKDGKTWHYRQTPFGLAKLEPQGDVDAGGEEELLGVIAHDRGDTVDFERKTPFSVHRWSKKKTELTKAERAVLDRAAKTAGSGSK